MQRGAGLDLDPGVRRKEGPQARTRDADPFDHCRRRAGLDDDAAILACIAFGDPAFECLTRRLDHKRARAVAIAKAYTSDASREVANRGVQVHGGIGFTWEHDLQLYYKRSKALEIFNGDSAVQRERLAEMVFDA